MHYVQVCTKLHRKTILAKRTPNSCTKRKKFVDIVLLNCAGTKPCSWVMINYVSKSEIIWNPFNTTRGILTGLRMDARLDAFSIVIIHILIYPFKGASRVN